MAVRKYITNVHENMELFNLSAIGEVSEGRSYFLTVELFGAIGDGITDDTAAIVAANNTAHNLELPLFFGPKTYLVDGATNFIIDGAKTQWFGRRTVIETTVPPNGYFIKIKGSSNYEQRYKMHHTVMEGFSILGGPQNSAFAGICLLLEDDGEFGTNNMYIRHVNIDGYETLIYIGDEAWGFTFEGNRYRWGNIISEDIYHERMVFRSCQFGGDVGNGTIRPYIHLMSGDFYFDGCSFDNQEIRVESAATYGTDVHVNNCHFENPSSVINDARFASVTGAKSRLSIAHSNFLIRDVGENAYYESAVFYCESGTRGLIISDFRISLQAWYRPEYNDAYRTLVAGGGRVLCDQFMIEEANIRFPIATSLNIINNHGFETGDITAWVNDDSGGGLTTVQSSEVKTGTYAAYFDINTTGSYKQAQIYQELQVKPGQHVLLSCWAKGTITGAGRLNIRINFYDWAGNLVEANTASTTATFDWDIKTGGQLVPIGATTARVIIGTSGSGTSLAQCYVDDIIVNVIE